jgi:hypothetical protein
VYGADLALDETADSAPASLLLRTKNDAAHHLGLPLPSGRIAVFAARGSETILLHESGMRDLAVDEEVEINLGDSPDVQVAATKEKTLLDPARTAPLPPVLPVPRVSGVAGVPAPRAAAVDGVSRVDISNARATEIHFELRLRLPPGARVVRADHALGAKNGRPIFRLTIPAQKTVTVRYQWQRAAG